MTQPMATATTTPADPEGGTAPAPAVSIEGAVKSFGAVRAVAGLDLGIARGETLALLGRNGAGKSTTLNLLLGLDEPDSGRVRLFGDTPERAVRSGRVGAMLQDGGPVRRTTVRELVSFVASTYPHPLPVSEDLHLAGLTELAARRVDKLSGGQWQRVRFAVALAGNPELIVLDEPTAALDVEARRAFWTSMRAYARRGNTVLFSTHYMEEADDNAEDRSLGWLRQLRITPMRPRQVVLGRAATSSVTVLPAILAVLTAGALSNGVRLDAWQWAVLVLVLWAGTLPFTLLGIGNGYRLSAQSAGVVNTGALMGLTVIGGLWFPIEAFPEWLRTLAEYTPAHGFAELGWATTDGHAPATATVAVLLGWLAAFGSYAVMSYRTSARTA
ncbi:ABC transporter ATP-binding protein/permease [Streptomyces sp. NPDC051217]|uniref:ABC transporter ATP-binding protein/permease n=1 Tax=Streptomyces sp. NPDC051217 TaxID=3365644 RepID=UPI0037B83ADB